MEYKTLIDPETGELVQAPILEDGDRIITEAQRKGAADYFVRESFKGRNAGFTFASMDDINYVIGRLTTAQCGYLLVLQCYVDYDGGRIVKGGSNEAMTSADMLEVLQLKRKRSTFYDFMSACLNAGIITQDDLGSYYVNPRYHFRGATQNRAVIRTYTAKVRQAYREVKAVDLGLMYRMLPYVHVTNNALCSNPTERDPKKIRWFNGKSLAAAIGVDEKTLTRRLPHMKFGGEYVIARTSVGPQRMFQFNPSVFYRGNKEPDESLVAKFNGLSA